MAWVLAFYVVVAAAFFLALLLAGIVIAIDVFLDVVRGWLE